MQTDGAAFSPTRDSEAFLMLIGCVTRRGRIGRGRMIGGERDAIGGLSTEDFQAMLYIAAIFAKLVEVGGHLEAHRGQDGRGRGLEVRGRGILLEDSDHRHRRKGVAGTLYVEMCHMYRHRGLEMVICTDAVFTTALSWMRRLRTDPLP